MRLAASPILMIDEFRVRGQPFQPHPHAGFSAVSDVFEDSAAALRSRDTLGNDLVVHAGGIVWSEAGSGMMHEELPATPGQTLHGLQFFVNLRAVNKLAPPRVLWLHRADVPASRSEAGDRIRIVLGSHDGQASPLMPTEPFNLLDVHLRSTQSIALDANQAAIVYVLSGAIQLRADTAHCRVGARQAVGLQTPQATVLHLRAIEPAQLVLLWAAPIHEPVVWHGPFVMNAQAQIDAAIHRHQTGAMGRLAPPPTCPAFDRSGPRHPDCIGASHANRVSPGTRRAAGSALHRDRSFPMHPEPLHDALSIHNFRDLAGLPLSAGTLRPRVLLRGEGPARLGTAQLAALQGLGIGAVCDLRAEAERQHAAFEWSAATRRIELNLPNDFADAQALGGRLLRGEPTLRGAVAAMCASYAAMPALLHAGLRELVAALQHGKGALLIHCTAGKDRTGVLVALLLQWLGCPAEAVQQDYLRSHHYGEALLRDVRPEQVSSWLGIPLTPDMLRALVGVDLCYLQAALDAVHARWASIDRYFAAAGLGEDARRSTLARLCCEAESGRLD